MKIKRTFSKSKQYLKRTIRRIKKAYKKTAKRMRKGMRNRLSSKRIRNTKRKKKAGPIWWKRRSICSTSQSYTSTKPGGSVSGRRQLRRLT